MNRPAAGRLAAATAVVLFLPATFTGCASSKPSNGSAKLQNAPVGLTVIIDSPKPAKQLANTAFGVHVSDRGKHARGASVTLTLTMPAMVMPPVTVACREAAPGYYTGVGTFTMPGEWHIEAHVELADGARMTASSNVQVR